MVMGNHSLKNNYSNAQFTEKRKLWKAKIVHVLKGHDT